MPRLSLAVLLVILGGCQRSGDDRARTEALIATRCGACHMIPGIATARGRVGPSLAGVADRQYLAGMIPNTPKELQAFLLHPQKAAPGGAMPELGLSPPQADAISRYLQTVR